MPTKIAQAPVSFALVAASSLVFLVSYQFKFVELVELFNFVPVRMGVNGIALGQPGDDWWRYLTPTLVHFSWMHIVFNCLWVWEFGRRIEQGVGSLNLLGLYLVSAVVSNAVQYFVQGPAIFGGMSGVVYALLGFIWIGNLLRPQLFEPLPPAILGFMLVWLLIGLTGALEVLGMGAIANGAHFGGLICGCLLGGVFGVLTKVLKN